MLHRRCKTAAIMAQDWRRTGADLTQIWQFLPTAILGPAYNRRMQKISLIVVFLWVAGTSALAGAQAPAPGVAPASRPDQTIERIRVEDAGSRIDEVRVGGQTQSITVQSKIGDNLPPYEVKPSDTSRGASPSTSRSDTTGSRVWNVLKF